MSEPQLTYESVLGLFREAGQEIRELRLSIKEQGAEFDKMRAQTVREKQERDAEYEKMRQETDRIVKETALQIKATNKKISELGSRIGEIVENMLGGRILDKFHALGYEVDDYTRNHSFRLSKLGIKGEIDLILHNGDISILIEVKTTLDVADVRQHVERIDKYRTYADARWGDTTRYIGAVAGAVVEEKVVDFAHENGLYTIVQSGEGVEIVEVPKDFQARVW